MNHQAIDTAAVFTPEAVATINRAYLKACDILARQDKAHLRDKLAEQVMYLARNGETDERRLCDLSVVVALGFDAGASMSAGRGSSARN